MQLLDEKNCPKRTTRQADVHRLDVDELPANLLKSITSQSLPSPDKEKYYNNDVNWRNQLRN